MLPVILVAVGAYLIGDSVLGDGKKYAKGGQLDAKSAKKRLEELRKALRAERISYGELAELESLKEYIDKDDVELKQAAGIPEFEDEDDDEDDDKYAKGGMMAKGGELDNLLKEQEELEFQLTDIKLGSDLNTDEGVDKYRKLVAPVRAKLNEIDKKLEALGYEPYAKGGETHRLDSIFEEGGEIAEGNLEMAMSNVKAIEHHAQELKSILDENTSIEAWVVAKLERAETDLSDVTHYIDGLKGEEVESDTYFAKGGELNDKPINFPTKNQTEESAKKWLNELIKEKGRKEAAKIVRYNLEGKNPYYRYNNTYDQWLSSATLNQEYAKGGMMAKGGGVYENFGKHIINDYLLTKDGTKVFVTEGYYRYPSTDGVSVEGIYYDVKYPNGEEKIVSVDNLVFPIKVPHFGGYMVTGISERFAKGGKLVGKQKKLDVNKNGKLDAEDFKMLRGKKMAKGGEVATKLKMLKEKSSGYFPNIEPTKEKSYYLWETPKNEKTSFIIQSKSIYSDVGSAFYVYDKDFKFKGSANTLNGFNDIKPIKITKSDIKKL